ncbi:hypothetical protein SHK09_15400 [Polaribacter sp. PL03]|uniref:hypothetical protein n=1 Tax=Polaribacter sp. PL03 TaxID=3088353 RepID=UPI0029CCE604|nr:hypothetical protein [Polaribacter sp. PL03]MDX6748182.1 hypothetical protein [Polaribacter sp. PL03]
MNKYNYSIDEIIEKILEEIDFDDILGILEEYPLELMEKISIETSLKYWNGDIDFNQGDLIMNIVYGHWVTNNNYIKNCDFSETLWECFEAFDSGEYHHNGDDKNIDPEEKYTKPMIENLLKKQKMIK